MVYYILCYKDNIKMIIKKILLVPETKPFVVE